MFPRTRSHKTSEPSPKILERSGRPSSLLHPRADTNHTSTSTDTGCPSLLMHPPRPLLHRKPVCPVRTLASHLGNGVGKAAALMNVAEAIVLVLREIARSRGATVVTAVARGTAQDTLHPAHGIDSIETPHPGGEIKTRTIATTLTYFARRFIFFVSVDVRQKDI